MFGKYVPARVKSALSPLRPVYDAWMRVVSGFAWVLIRVLLVLLYVTAFLFYGIVLRLLRKDPLKRRFHEDVESYWDGTVKLNDSLEDFENQY